MSAPTTARMMRPLARSLPTKAVTRSMHARAATKLQQAPKPRLLVAAQLPSRSFSVARPVYKGLQPDQEEPVPVESEAIHDIKDATPISDEDFHEHAEKLLEEICAKMEEMQESREDVDAEYSAGVLNITFPPIGTYVLNKQPPNKQIWLSSPVTGPKRFDWVVKGDDINSKEGSAVGDWVYLRDGTSLIALLRKELGITVGTEDGSME